MGPVMTVYGLDLKPNLTLAVHPKTQQFYELYEDTVRRIKNDELPSTNTNEIFATIQDYTV